MRAMWKETLKDTEIMPDLAANRLQYSVIYFTLSSEHLKYDIIYIPQLFSFAINTFHVAYFNVFKCGLK